MTDTSNLGLPCIDAAQARKHVTHNEALRILDTLVQLAVLDRDLNAPPASPSEGQRWIVKASPAPTGAWAGRGNQVAAWQDGGWQFSVPNTGWIAYVADESVLVTWNGSAWADGLPALQNLTLLGVGTTADATNPFSAKLNNTLWTAKTVAEGGDGNLRYKLSKEDASKTLSYLFQDNFSGRAEIGLTGDDDFHFKTSADGTTWNDALLLDKTTGATKVNSGFFLTGTISPAQITADQNDYNPAGLAGASVLRLSTDASRNITGLSGGGNGRLIEIYNVGANAIVLKNQSASSSAANRFLFGADVTVSANQSALVYYDATQSRWLLRARSQASSGSGDLVSTNNLSDLAQKYTGFDNISVHGADIASAATVNLEAATGNLVDVTGTATITAITLSDGHERTVRFTGILTLTNGAALVLPGAANITTAAGDYAVFRGYAAGVVRCIEYNRADGTPLALASASVAPTQLDAGNTTKQAALRAAIFAAPFDALAFNGMQINGSMDVSQENGTNAVSLATGTAKYVIDTWQGKFVRAATLAIDCQQVAPPGSPSFQTAFGNALQIKATTGLASLANGDYGYLEHLIEGYRTAQLGFGSSNAQSVTIGFWVYATIAGTMTVALLNSAANRAIPVNVTINNANTWEWKTVTFAGDTSGTWLATTGIGLRVRFCFGAGSTFQGTNNTWTGSEVFATSATTNFFASTNNLACITGVVVLPGTEAPSSARSPFIMRPYANELLLSLRYWVGAGGAPFKGQWLSASVCWLSLNFLTPMRATPTLTMLTASPVVTELSVGPRTGSSSVFQSTIASTLGMHGEITGFSGATAHQGAYASTNPLVTCNARL